MTFFVCGLLLDLPTFNFLVVFFFDALVDFDALVFFDFVVVFFRASVVCFIVVTLGLCVVGPYFK